MRDRAGRAPAPGAGAGRRRDPGAGAAAGPPAGPGRRDVRVHPVSLPPGATLALYTDGLVESRAQPLDDGLEALQKALRTALADPAVPLDDACEAVTKAMRQHGEDDITLVLARIRQ